MLDSKPKPDERIEPPAPVESSWRWRWSLIRWLMALSGVGLFFAALRWLTRTPELLISVSVLGLFLIVILSPLCLPTDFTSGQRAAFGCCLLPLGYLVMIALLSFLVLWLHGFMYVDT